MLRSERMSMLKPSAIALSAAAQSWSKAFSSPSPPWSAGNSASRVVALKPSSETSRSWASCLLSMQRVVEADHAAALRAGIEQVALGAEEGFGGGDEFLADAVERRVGDLGEDLLEILIEMLRLVRRARRAACRCPSRRSAGRRWRPWARAACGGPRRCSRRRAGARGCGLPRRFSAALAVRQVLEE